MSCSGWSAVERGLAARDLSPDIEPPEWAAARRHLATCGECRRAAMANEPTLLFAALPAPVVGEHDVTAMQEAVAALVRAGRVDRGAPRRRAVHGSRSARLRGIAAAAAVAALALAVDPGARSADRLGGSELAAAGIVSEDALSATYPAVLEELDRPDARVYQIPAEGYSVVMIVDASLDV